MRGGDAQWGAVFWVNTLGAQHATKCEKLELEKHLINCYIKQKNTNYIQLKKMKIHLLDEEIV